MNIVEAVAAIAPGTTAEISLDVGNLASGAPIVIPLVVVKGTMPGPCLWVSGQVHGDEVNGIFAALEFARSIQPADVSGTIIVSGTANPYALNARHRRAPQDSLDMDQSFPGHASGSTTERTARVFYDAVNAVADHLVSLHTTMATFDSVLFAAYKTPRHPDVSEQLMLRCMGQFKPVFACVMPDGPRAGDSTGHTAGSIDFQILHAGKTAFMIELGGGGVYTPQVVRQAVDGLFGTAAILGLLARDPIAVTSLLKVTESRGLTASKGGLFRPELQPGRRAYGAGAIYGNVIDLFGHTVEAATHDGPYRLIAVRRHPIVDTGDRLAIAALKWSTVKV